MQFPLKSGQNPQKNTVLDFIDNYFPFTPVDELSTELLLEKLCTICENATFSSSLINLLNIGVELGLNQDLVQTYLLKAYKAAKGPDDVGVVYRFALEYNNKSIYGKAATKEEIKAIIYKAIQHHRLRCNWVSEGKTTAKTPH